MLAHCPRCWANISPVLGYHVVFGATLNVRQHHRQWANINPALVQSIMPVPTACRYCQHEVLTRAKWILASTSDAGPTFNRLCVGVGLYLPPAVSTTTPACYWTQLALNQCWFDTGPASQTVGQHWTSIGSTSCLLGVLTSHIVFRTTVQGSKRNNKFRLIHSLYCPQGPFNNINYKSHWHYIS